MPEGDTVWLAGRRLDAALRGQVLTRTDFRVPQHATADLSGRRVLEVASRGKHLLFRIEGGTTLHTHFRMDGSWHLYRPGRRWGGGPDFQVRVVLQTAPWTAVGYRLPVVELLPTADEDEAVGHLGPDLLADDWGEPMVAEAVRRLSAAPATSIGEALLDQRNVAGMGTVYRAEVLFLEGLHPRLPVGSVPDLAKPVRRGHALLHRNRNRPEQSTTGSLERGADHWVYGRGGKPCRVCGTRIEVEEYGPLTQERLSYWCPTCQALPGAAPPAQDPGVPREGGVGAERPSP
ncbi:endonuclease-8 [Motilibacter rhizosphaerae]|uniref:DNA-(apurinic or apyrimidinic site) lyase n=1 Tax=Motilibacter rhizosphaerae TaxID=598652 RepID=A0A4Q7NPN5_9ACTN|nr:DNA-formamidopyrimidine glycosylase family protein [Motilibacter rhizosphaerae]RZS86926.1 endonuclease-8 [Motilibacter rhizosphaerae]